MIPGPRIPMCDLVQIDTYTKSLQYPGKALKNMKSIVVLTNYMTENVMTHSKTADFVALDIRMIFRMMDIMNYGLRLYSLIA